MSRFETLILGRSWNPLVHFARFGLRLASVPYGLGVRLRNRRFDSGTTPAFRAAVPVISIGNLTLGGTGKTPVVELLARHFRDRDLRPVILSRGYGSSGGLNDEGRVLADNLPDVPQLQGADRVALAMTAVEELEAELLLLDDGFQHRRLHRDLDIVLVDATRPLREEFLFPRGTLREPVGGLGRASLVWLTRCDAVDVASVDAQQEWLRRRFPSLPVVRSNHEPQDLLDASGASFPRELLADRPVAAFCGIGNPTAFRHTLTGLRAVPIAFREFSDHHNYRRDDVRDLTTWASGLPPDAVVAVTQKDMVKLRLSDLAGRPVYAVRIGVRITAGQTALDECLATVLPRTNDPD